MLNLNGFREVCHNRQSDVYTSINCISKPIHLSIPPGSVLKFLVTFLTCTDDMKSKGKLLVDETLFKHSNKPGWLLLNVYQNSQTIFKLSCREFWRVQHVSMPIIQWKHQRSCSWKKLLGKTLVSIPIPDYYVNWRLCLHLWFLKNV